MTPGFSVIIRASAARNPNARLAMMEFPKAAIIGLVGDADVVPHDYTLDGLDPAARVRFEAEIEAKRRSGATVLIRAKDVTLLRSVADEVWWLSGGGVRAKGHPDEVLREFQREVLRGLNDVAAIPAAMRRGDGRARLLRLETLDGKSDPVNVWHSGEAARIRLTVQFHSAVANPVVGIMIRTRIGMDVYGTNTELEKVAVGPCEAGDTRAIVFEFECNLCPQLYTVTAASHDPDGVWHDWMEDAIAISVVDSRYTAGVANLRARVTCSRE